MNLKEACEILDVQEDISEDDLKKVYRKAAAKYHPDVYKEDSGEKFKKITEAFNTIKDPPSEGFNISDIFGQSPYAYHGSAQNNFGGVPIDFFQNFVQNSFNVQFNIVPDINILCTITYDEFISGCSKKISYKRISNKRTEEKLEYDLKIPAYAPNLRIKDKGHFKGSIKGNDMYSNLFVGINIQDEKFKVQNNVLSFEEKISMKDAVFGNSIDVDLKFIKLKISLPPMTKNRDIISFNMENSFFKNVVITWIVEYPENIKEIL